jgi:hypothetical protein
MSKLGRCPPTAFEREVVRVRFKGSFRLLNPYGFLLWQGTLQPIQRVWWIRIPYPLDGAVKDDVGYPRVEVLGLHPSPHRIGDWLCLFDPDDEALRWYPEHGISRLIELTALWLDAYERWLRALPAANQLPASLWGLQIFDKLVPESAFPPWPAAEAPHGRRLAPKGKAA